MRVIRSIRVGQDRTIELRWDDGTVSVVEFEPIIEQGGVFTPLAEAAFFELAALDERGRVLRWPGEIDFCADALYEMGRMPAKGRNDEGQIRETLTPLVELAERRDVAVLGVMHVGKPGSGRRTPVQMLLGSTVFGALPRVVMMTGRGDGDAGRRMVLRVVTSNLAGMPGALEWSRPEDSAIVWHGAVGCSMEELLARAGARRRSEGRGALEIAVGLLRELLADGPVASREVDAAMLEAGASAATIKRAKQEVGIVARRASGAKVVRLLHLAGEPFG